MLIVFYCPGKADGVAAIVVKTDKVDQGRPVGSGSAVSSVALADCTSVKAGYYFDSDGTCATGIQASGATCVYRLCDDPTTDAFCPGGASVTDVTLDTGRTTCNFGTRTFCDVAVGAEGIGCTKNEDCISP